MATQKNTGTGMTIGVAAAVAGAAAAGAYWLYGAKGAAKHRKLARSWMLKARAEVLERVEGADLLDRETYTKIVTDVVKNYSKVKDATGEQVAQVTKDLMSAWGHMQKAYKQATPKAVKKSPRAKK